MSGLASTTKLPPGIPSLRQAEEASSIRLREISSQDNGLKASRPSGTKSEHIDWLRLAAREVLGRSYSVILFDLSILVYTTFFTQVDLKYITDAQIIEFAFEGKRRRFAIDSIAAKISPDATDDPSQLPWTFSVLSIDSPPQLWSVTWDSVISIATNDIPNKDAASHKVRLFNCDRLYGSHDTPHVSPDSKKSRFWLTNR